MTVAPNAQAGHSERKDVSRVPAASPVPNLIDFQRVSYNRFLQMEELPGERDEIGLDAVFKSVFPIADRREMSELEFVSYSIGDWECTCGSLAGLDRLRMQCQRCGEMIASDPKCPQQPLCSHCGRHAENTITVCQDCGDPIRLKLKFGVDECRERGLTYAAPLKVTLKLTVYEKDPADRKQIRDIKEQEVYFGDIPLMTDDGTFVISGAERVVVSQLQRSPGVFFESSNDRSHCLGKIIPYRGSWVAFDFDKKNLLNARIDRKPKFLGTIFLRALGLTSDAQILSRFYKVTQIRSTSSGTLKRRVSETMLGTSLAKQIEVGGKVIRKGRKVTPRLLQQLREGGTEFVPCWREDLLPDADKYGAVFADDLSDPDTGKGLPGCEANASVSVQALLLIAERGISEFGVIFPEADECGVVLSETLHKDRIKTQYEALLEIYRKIRPGDPPTRETAWALFQGMFFDQREFDLSSVGRMNLNIKLHDALESTPLDCRVLEAEDFYAMIRHLFKLRRNIGTPDDINHLGNRRVRGVGELLEDQFRIGLIRMERSVKERMTIHEDITSVMPHELINPKTVMAAVREFFGSSQFSQFMDQVNPLAEITHKRRLSALGPGGLSPERAGVDMRDVHPTHYGRICPIETPDGPDVGLISSLSCFARINEYGFIESPYRRVQNGRIVDEVRVVRAGVTDLKRGHILPRDEAAQANAALEPGRERAEFETYCAYLSAWEEDKYVIAHADIPVDKDGNITSELASCRVAGDTQLKQRAEIQYSDVSPKQVVSVAASLIPFLENDDANRALIGSKMQRQAVPLLRTEPPVVGTGMERIIARDSGAVAICKRGGMVDSVDSERIVVRVEGTGTEERISRDGGADVYQLVKFRRSNQNTCINQKPIVQVGQRVEKGTVLADGPCTADGELALGRNVLVAFMPWRGYNFEDAILVSEKLIKDDCYTSLHVEEFDLAARETKLGPEEITRDVPNVSESLLRNLDESGIIRVGSAVGPGDILVGRVVPKRYVHLTPEEKLLGAIFNAQDVDIADASLRCPPEISGIVLGIKVFVRKGVGSDTRALEIKAEEIEKLECDLEDSKRILFDQRAKRLQELLGGRVVQADYFATEEDEPLVSAGDVLGKHHFDQLRGRHLKRLELDQFVPDKDKRIDRIEANTARQFQALEDLIQERKDMLQEGDELPPGVIKSVKVFVAMKRKLSVGDKMGNRHGNKGVVARVLPEEDMPFLADGTPVEIVLNPLGVPSRMNVGQILETHLGWAGKELGIKFAVPVFEGLGEKRIKQHLAEAGLPESGKTKLYDGLTGHAFEQEVTVGVVYMLKLSHMVDDKVHARSVGPYSLITQQPMGGKAVFGGQRIGEMEVWALQAYGAAHILQELLTAKSDDVYGRAGLYESIMKGECAKEPGAPESLNVLIRELQSLCLDVELVQRQQELIEDALNPDQPALQPSIDPEVQLSTDRDDGEPSEFASGEPSADQALGGGPMAGTVDRNNQEENHYDDDDDDGPQVSLTSDFDAIKIGLASPEKIRSWSHGEVTKPETINYRTFKPERHGLFCTAIFGPVTDWECLCRRFVRMKHRGKVCDRCGTEVTLSRVRRERLGHIELAAPCSHVWYVKLLPSRIAQLLDMSMRDLERVLYYEAYIVVDTEDPDALPLGEVLTEDRKLQLEDKKLDFTAIMGAEGIKDRLESIDTTQLARQLREEMKTGASMQKRLKSARRLGIVESIRESGNKPEWMILEVIPVIPPELRPLVPLDGDRFATSDLNDLYRRVINRNNRLRKLIDLRAPEMIVRSEKRMLQEAVDALFDNGCRGRPFRGARHRPLKSLADTFKGKHGRFRQDLLGKRVDYSGRSVIVVGPELKLHQCGLPKQMALELFKPFVYQRLEQRGYCTSVKHARELVELRDGVVWDAVEDVIKDHPILLNRAPTLHRLGIQAFEPVLVEGKAIKVHPLVCTAFNADFDGDQMAVHVPLSPEAQVEAHALMLSTRNILSPANGAPVTVPSQDMVLGVYYLTSRGDGSEGEGRSFGSTREVMLAFDTGDVDTRSRIRLNYSGPVLDLATASNRQDILQVEPVLFQRQPLDTTVGRIILNDRLPDGLPFFNGLLKKKGLSQLVRYCYLHLGREQTVAMLDELKELGFLYATLSGMSIGIDDMVVPEPKEQLVRNAQKDAMQVHEQYLDGAITRDERYTRVIEIWSKLAERVSEEIFDDMRDGSSERLNPVYAMADSGARGSERQIRQLSGMRGLTVKPSGEIIETPITASFREGLNVSQYFMSTHGTRKRLADTALKAAHSGYLTRRLVFVAQDVIVTENDCGNRVGIDVEAPVESGKIRESLADRIDGRVAANDVRDSGGRIIVAANGEITAELAEGIERAGIERVWVRSVLTCETDRGVCQLCYGRDLSTGRLVERGEAIGIVAAQSIGEPGTQATLRTSHVDETALPVREQSRQTAKSDGTVKYIDESISAVEDRHGNRIAINRNGIIAVLDFRGRERERYAVPCGARLLVADGGQVRCGDSLLEWDPHMSSILTQAAGQCHFVDLAEGLTLREEIDELSGMSQWIVQDDPARKRDPRIEIRDEAGEPVRKYLIPRNACLQVQDGDQVRKGDTLARIPRETTMTRDITGGLPRVEELFEARHPRETAVIAEVDGVVSYGELKKTHRKVAVTDDDGTVREHNIPRGVRINVQEGERVRAGDSLTDGSLDPHEILRVLGKEALQNYLVNEIQAVYRAQGVDINDKHLEVIVRQMMRWIKVREVNDTCFLIDQAVDEFEFRKTNAKVVEDGGIAATGQPLLMGITKASLATDSFLSAAAFQFTTRVLAAAAVAGKVDELRGLKENVIVGRLIPAGTGLGVYRRFQIKGKDAPEQLARGVEHFSRVPGQVDEGTHIFQAEFAKDRAIAAPPEPPKPTEPSKSPKPAKFISPGEFPE